MRPCFAACLATLLLWPQVPGAEPAPTFVKTWGRTGTAPGLMRFPAGVATDADGNVYVAEISGKRIQKFDSLGTFLRLWGGAGHGEGQFAGASDLVVDSQRRLWVTDRENHRLQWFTLEGEFLGVLGDSSKAEFHTPNGLGLDPNGPYLFVADSFNQRIRKFDISGERPRHVLTFGEFGSAPGQFVTPIDVAISSTGEIHTVDFALHRLQIFTPEGHFRLALGRQGSAPGQFNAPAGVYVDELDRIYIVDTFNGRVQKFERNGRFVLAWGPAGNKSESMGGPIRMTITPTGLIYICDYQTSILNLDRILVFRLGVETGVEKRTITDVRSLYRGR